jgi:hypothetical protein
MKALSSVRNVLSLTRRRSTTTDTEERNLFGTSIESGTPHPTPNQTKMPDMLDGDQTIYCVFYFKMFFSAR